MELPVSEFGVIAILVVILYKVITEIINKKKDNAVPKISDQCRECYSKIKDLHLWHSKEDTDGVKVWYMRKSLEEAVISLSNNLEKQTQILSDIHNEQKQILREVRKS